MKRLYLALAFHNHQPVGNFDFVFAEAFARAYLPLLELLEHHPSIKLALHYTGPLRDWLVQNQNDFIARIRALVSRGQIEVMTGGYYEPILAAIPDDDKRGQIQQLTRAVKSDFGFNASGLWLAERVWEPSLAKPIAEAGVEYTIVDDTHFKYVGLEDRDLLGYYVTEEQGATLKIFGTSKYLRYAIPWSPVEQVVGWLREQASEDGTRVAVMGDDGEKFGLWPGTYEHCWGSRDEARAQGPRQKTGWMEEFFRALEQNQDWLVTTTLADYARNFPAIGRVYLPTASYDEMSEWALPAKLSGELMRVKHQLEEEKRDDLLRFIKGGFWRNFLVKYPEVNGLHKKMLLVSEKVGTISKQLMADSGSSLTRIETDPQPVIKSLHHLYAGQCNCPYWHGVFGGIYLPHIRTANYEHLIQAENIVDRMAHGQDKWMDWELADFDKDGMNELLINASEMNLYFDLARGGSLFEWDWRAKNFNLLNTLSRREEGYHRDLVEAAARDEVELPGAQRQKVETIHSAEVRAKEPGLERQLNYDWYRRVGLIDHFLHADTKLNDFARAQYGELGDFCNQEYEIQITPAPAGGAKESEKSKGSGENELVVVLSRDGHVWQGDAFVPLRLEKQLTIVTGCQRLPIVYALTNTGDQAIAARFGSEFCFGLLAGHSDDAYYRADLARDTFHHGGGEQSSPREVWHLDSQGQVEADLFSLVNKFLRIEILLKLKTPTCVWRMPIETVSLSEAGFERVYQGSSIMPLWDVNLKPHEKWYVEFEFELVAR
jgi:4-alpha-glucanotransferase